jgi:hypothetical protein
MNDEKEWIQKIESLETDKVKFAVTDIDGGCAERLVLIQSEICRKGAADAAPFQF